MKLVEIILLLVALFGHCLLWLGVLNRIHATGMPRWTVELFSLPCRVLCVVMPAVIAYAWLRLVEPLFSSAGWPILSYVLPCVLLAIFGIGVCIARQIAKRYHQHVIESSCSTQLDLATQLEQPIEGGTLTQWLSRLPGNQVLKLEIQEIALRLPRLATELDGLRIAHLSDLHMSGRIGRAYFEEVVRHTNALGPDLIAITGDLFDATRCLGWIPETLAQLEAPLGVFFVFGNHDRRVDERLARHLLTEAGLTNLGGEWVERWRAEQRIVLAGNELPWFSPAADMETCPGRTDDSPQLRIALAHAPDQIDWAQGHDFDLMLAGHTHGGQVCFPVVGPLLAPSRLGTRYAGGTFRTQPTVLHVSRGVSALTPLRWNCLPELTMLTLCSPQPTAVERPATLAASSG